MQKLIRIKNITDKRSSQKISSKQLNSMFWSRKNQCASNSLFSLYGRWFFKKMWFDKIYFDTFWSNWFILIQCDSTWSNMIHFDPIWSSLIQFDPDLSKQIKMLHSVHVTASFQSYVHCIRRICRVANVRTRSLLCTISVSSLTGICSRAVPAQGWFS